MSFRPFGFTPPSLGGLQDEMSRLLERVWHGGVQAGPFDGQSWAPMIDLYEYDHCYVIYVEVPGVSADRIDVSILGDSITIRGQKNPPAGIDGQAGNRIRDGRRYGAFSRSVELPPDIDADKLSACCQEGVLEITLPKSAGAKPRTVKVRVDA
jgi:HSP20 family protein